MKNRDTIGHYLVPGMLFGLGFIIPTVLIFFTVVSGSLPVDYSAYHFAAQRAESGEPLYVGEDEARTMWEMMHAIGEHPQALAAVQRGPYLYPPSLALWFNRLNVNPVVFTFVLLLSIAGFGVLWLNETGRSGWWLLFVLGSWEVLASFLGGNVELLLLFLAVSSAWFFWRGHPAGAGLCALPVLLVKPFYLLFFVAFAVFTWAGKPLDRKEGLKGVGLATVAMACLFFGELLYGGAAFRAYLGEYFSAAGRMLWFDLPIAEQTPMSIWNRTLPQGLVLLGAPFSVAVWLAFGVWLVLTAVTAITIRGTRLPFPLAAALSLVLLYWTRPVGWGFVYLEIVVVLAMWPHVRRGWRGALFAAALLLAASHWAALVLTARGRGIYLFTLQQPQFPWETWLVLPLCWFLLVRVTRRR
jgi:hypothetical protein